MRERTFWSLMGAGFAAILGACYMADHYDDVRASRANQQRIIYAGQAQNYRLAVDLLERKAELETEGRKIQFELEQIVR